MKIKGFTLAEVLIVLTILGVIAAMTLPALNTNVQRQQMGPALMRAISTLETANALVAQEHDFYNFAESCHDYLNDCFEPFVKEKIGAAKLNEDINYSPFNNPSITAITPTNGYVTNNGIIYYIENANLSNDINSHMLIFVDVNGNKRPNVVGKDLFLLALLPDNESSKIYAVGSRALNERLGYETWENGICDSTGVNSEKECAGSIVDNGGRVIYPW